MKNTVYMENTITKKGTIHLSDQVRITDPCYDMDTWCAGTLSNVLEGSYQCFLSMNQDGCVSAIEVRHTDYLDTKAKTPVPDLEVGVDSGQAGIFDQTYYEEVQKTRQKWNSFYDRVCNLTYHQHPSAENGYHFDGNPIDGKGFVSASGDGDGSYVCRVGKNADDKIVAIRIDYYPERIIFLDNEEEEQEERD